MKELYTGSGTTDYKSEAMIDFGCDQIMQSTQISKGEFSERDSTNEAVRDY